MPVLQEILKRCFSMAQRDVLIFIDAINECCDHETQSLTALYDVVCRNECVKMMTTSTETPMHFADLTKSQLSRDSGKVDMDLKSVEDDIKTYVDTRIMKEARLTRLRADIQEKIRSRLYSKSRGSFRWVQCALDGLAQQNTPKAMIAALDDIPATLEDVYLSILDRIPADSVELAQSTLELLVSAASPLSVAELAEAAAFKSAGENFDPDDRLIEPNSVVSQLRSLVHVNPMNRRVELAHSSVRDFLTSERRSSDRYHIDAIAASDMMTRLCVKYLSLPAFQDMCKASPRKQPRIHDLVNMSQRFYDWPFYWYAAHLWSRHARRSGGRCVDDILRFLNTSELPGGGNFASFYQAVYRAGDAKVWLTKPLYTCAREGLVDVTRALLATDIGRAQLEIPGGRRMSTPLHVASTYDWPEVVRVLLEAGANPNERNGAGEAGIQWAQRYRNYEVVRLLLDAGADRRLLKDSFGSWVDAWILEEQEVEQARVQHRGKSPEYKHTHAW